MSINHRLNTLLSHYIILCSNENEPTTVNGNGCLKNTYYKRRQKQKGYTILVLIIKQQVKVTWCFQVRIEATLEKLGGDCKGVLNAGSLDLGAENTVYLLENH